MTEEHKCRNCGTTDNVTFEPNPYDMEIRDDYTDVWECYDCRQEGADDI